MPDKKYPGPSIQAIYSDCKAVIANDMIAYEQSGCNQFIQGVLAGSSMVQLSMISPDEIAKYKYRLCRPFPKQENTEGQLSAVLILSKFWAERFVSSYEAFQNGLKNYDIPTSAKRNFSNMPASAGWMVLNQSGKLSLFCDG